ncbi:hypothetical protein E1262_29745, partial [Jiangella aurantiaca]
MAPTGPESGFGPNEWLVEEFYESWLEDPSSVDPQWAEFFAERKAAGTAPAAPPAGRGDCPSPPRNTSHGSATRSAARPG